MSAKTPVKTLQAILLVGLCSAMTAAAQTSTVPSESTFAPGVAIGMQHKLEAMTAEERQKFLDTHPRIRARFEEGRIVLGKYAQMPPAEQQQFLLTHGGLQKFIQSHPQATARAEGNASEAKPGVIDPNHPRVNEVNRREENQQQRIGQGDAAGTLSAGQTGKIEGQEQKIQNKETADMDAHNGHLTEPEKRQLNRNENRVSAEIFDDKHGMAADPNHPRVTQVTDRQVNQQARISQGEGAGTLSKGEAAGIEKQEGKIQSQKVADMKGDGGHLTRKEQRQLNKKENHTSHEIHKDKHGKKKP
jgi:hypothetical protein